MTLELGLEEFVNLLLLSIYGILLKEAFNNLLCLNLRFMLDKEQALLSLYSFSLANDSILLNYYYKSNK